MLRRLIASLVAPFLLCACATTAPSTALPSAPEDATGIVSAADERAAQAGAEILRKGGNATDAAIAAMLALAVVEPQSSGIGGGGFLLHADPGGAMTTFDGRETAPATATPDWFLGTDGQPLPFGTAKLSGLSVGVPGNIRLAAMAHARHGSLEWQELFEPAIRLARDGFRVTPRLLEFLTRHGAAAAHDPEGRALFFDDAGHPLPVGTLVRNPALAATLAAIAAKGPQAFYEGRNAGAIATRVAAQTPHRHGMAATDLAAYRAIERAPVCGFYRLYRICGMGPPSSGATTVLAILKQVERFDLAALGSTSPVAWHLFAESQRLAYADRELYLADGDFVAVPVAGLTDPDYLDARGRLISPMVTMAVAQAGTPPGMAAKQANGAGPEEGGTSHFVAVDGQGAVANYTSTIEGAFGSGLMVGGYYLNNELTDFSFIAVKDGRPVANRVEGGKRPRSSMAPTFVQAPDGRLVLAVGAAGGATIPVQVARVIVGVIDWGLNVEQALALPVLFAPADTLFVEKGSALESMIPALAQLGHARIEPRELPIKTNALQWTPDGWIGAADPRGEGAAISE